MGHVIAVAGKGGVGKTTLTGLLIQYLCQSGKKPVLAVDADANSNLNEVLGVEAGITLGELREEIERAGADSRYKIPAGVTKKDYLEARLTDALTEEDDFDLMIMGRSQGQGCYCFVNGLVQTQIQKLQSHYPYVVVDNEAGMEHVSRGILPMMEIAILVSDCSRRGVQAAGRTQRKRIGRGLGLLRLERERDAAHARLAELDALHAGYQCVLYCAQVERRLGRAGLHAQLDQRLIELLGERGGRVHAHQPHPR